MRLFVSVLTSWRHIYTFLLWEFPIAPPTWVTFWLWLQPVQFWCVLHAHVYSLLLCFWLHIGEMIAKSNNKAFLLYFPLKSSAFLSFLQFITMLSLFDYMILRGLTRVYLVKILFLCMWVFCLHVYLCTMYFHVTCGGQRGCWVPWNWSYK